MSKLRVLDLFSGIGGFSLGLERTGGFETVAFCEIEPFPRRVLAKHWPGVPIYEDVRTLTAGHLAADGISVDVICGGFPCQDISTAGKGAGIDGPRSGLWREYSRLIDELRPDFVFIENVPALRTRGADRVLSDLAALNYAGEPIVVGAIHAGAPHRRQRVWIVAHAGGKHSHQQHRRWSGSSRASPTVSDRHGPIWNVANAGSDGRLTRWPCDAPQGEERGQPDRGRFNVSLANADIEGLEIEFARNPRQCEAPIGSGGQWASEPDVGRVAHGVPSRVDRLKSLGNAVVPQIPELIGHAILASLEATPSRLVSAEARG